MQQVLKFLHAVVMKIPGVGCYCAAPFGHRIFANAPLFSGGRPGAVRTFLQRRWFGAVAAVICLAALLALLFASPHRTSDSERELGSNELSLVGENATGTIDLGELAVGSRTQCRFTIRNTGTAALPFAVSSSCTCGTVQPRSGVICADGSLDLLVAMEPRDFRVNGIYQITLRPDGTGARPLQMAVRYSCPPPIIVSPTELTLKNKNPSEPEILRSIRITNVHGDPVDRGGEIRTDVSHDWLAAAGETTKRGEITIRLNATKAPADGLGVVTVTHIRTGYTVYVTVHHRAEGALVVTPRHLFLRKDSRTGDYMATILVRSRRTIHPTAFGMAVEPIVLQTALPNGGRPNGDFCMYTMVKPARPPGPRSGMCRLTEETTKSTADISWQIID